MDYVVGLLNISPVYYIAITVICFFVLIWKRKWEISFLAGYIFLIFSVTVLSRSSTGVMQVEWVPFWSYRHSELREQILMNILVYVPVGFMAFRLVGRKAFLIGLCVSFLVEMSQLLACRGLFEFDDIIHNTIGTAVGVGLYLTICGIYKTIRLQMEHPSMISNRTGVGSCNN